MEQTMTCGQGLARQSILPARISELFAAMADTLESHVRALDVDDPAARAERAAYETLVRTHRGIESRLRTGAQEMAALVNLPMARHDLSKLGDERAIEVFQSYVRAEEELLELLTRSLVADREMLERMTTTTPAR